MFRNRGLFSGLWRPKNPHSLDHLKYLYSVLYKNQTVTEANRSLLVETLRSIAEILIWGDQNDSTVFDFFLERNMLSFFLKIMNQKCGSYVCVQLLQTLNILFENIRNETSIYYLLSNNHVNSIIVHKFDFSDEEVMAYYISFLKTLSFRLNKHTIHFFYNEHTNDFPLYTEAIKFFNHSESMVRIAVRTLTLNVYRVEEESMLKFVIDKTAVPYFANLVWFIGNHILEIDACVRNDADHRSLNRLKDLVAEHLDHLHYLNDILSLEIDNLNEVLTDHLLNRLFIPLYIFSLVRKSNANSLEDMKPHVSKVTALFLICQVFLIITHVPLIRLLAWIIFAGDSEVFTETGAAKLALFDAKRVENFDLSLDLPIFPSRRTKPSFVAPALPLETSLKEQIRKEEQKEREEAKRKKKKEKNKRRSAERELAKTEEEEMNNKIHKAPEGEESIITNDSRKSESPALPDGLDDAVLTGSADPKDLSITDEEKEQLRLAAAAKLASKHAESLASSVGEKLTGESFSLDGRPFLTSVFESLDPSENDYLALFALCLLYVIQQNSGMGESLLTSVRIPSSRSLSKNWYNTIIIEKLLRILVNTCQYGSKIRLITLDVTIMLVRELVIQNQKSFLSDDHFAHIEGIKEESTLMLRNFYKSEEIFLDMFEDEYREASKPYLTRMEFVLCDASLLLPPTGTPLTGIEFPKRLPCGEVERARHSIRTFFRLRQLSLEVQGKMETQLPLSNPDSCIQIQDVLDLNNSDLLAVTVTTSGSSSKDPASIGTTTKQRRFLVVDVYQIVLVEPDSTRLGWGVATFVGFLQDLEVVTDKDDSRCLHVTVHSPGSGSCYGEPEFGRTASARGRSTAPLLSATFTFDDHIRCMAAKQRLTKGRVKARQRKMHQIARLLEMPGNIGPSCPSPPAVNLHLLRKEAAAQRRSRSGNLSGGTSNHHFGGITLSQNSTAASSTTTATSGIRPYRPMFGTPGKVPGSASLLRASETGRLNSARTQSRSTTPESNQSDENSDELGSQEGGERRLSLRSHQRRMAAAKLSSQIPPSSSPGRKAQSCETGSSAPYGSPSSTSFMRRTLSSSSRLQPTESQNIPLEDYGPIRSDQDEEEDACDKLYQ